MDAIWREPWRVALTLALQAGGQLVQAGAVAAGVVAATATASGQPIHLLGVEWGSVHTPLRVAALAGAVLGSLVAAAGVGLWGKVLVARCARRYEEHAAGLAIERYATGFPSVSDPAVRDERDVVRLLTRDVRYASRAVLEALLGLPGVVTILVAGAGLMWLDSWATAGLTLLLLCVMPLYRWVNRRGAASLLGIEKYAREDALEKAATVRRLTRVAPPPERAAAWAKHKIAGESSDLYLEAYVQRLVAAHWSIFVGNLQFALVVAAAIAYVGFRVVAAETDHGNVHALPGASLYLVGLVVVLGSLRSTAKHLTNLAIFEPSFGRWVRFVRRSREARREDLRRQGLNTVEDMPTEVGTPEERSTETGTPEVRVSDPPAGSLERCPLPPGAPVCVFAGEALTRLSVPRVLAAVLHDQPGVAAAAAESAAFVRPDYPPTGGSLAESLNADQSSGRHGILEPLRAELLASTRRDPSQPISLKRWNRLSPSTRFLLALLATIENGPEWLLLEQKAFKKLSPEHREAVLSRLGVMNPPPRVLLVYSFIPDRLREYMGDHFVLLREGRAVFIGRRERFEELRETVVRCAQTTPSPRSGPTRMVADSAGEDMDVLLD